MSKIKKAFQDAYDAGLSATPPPLMPHQTAVDIGLEIYDVQIDPDMRSTKDDLIIGAFLSYRGMRNFVLAELKKLGIERKRMVPNDFRTQLPYSHGGYPICVQWCKREVRP